MTDVTAFVEDKQTSEFYPTPEKLADRMLGKVRHWETVEAILEPSAGKGDIIRQLARRHITQRAQLCIDCIEIDQNLRAILKYTFSAERRSEIVKKRLEVMKKRCEYAHKDYETKLYQYYDSTALEFLRQEVSEDAGTD